MTPPRALHHPWKLSLKLCSSKYPWKLLFVALLLLTLFDDIASQTVVETLRGFPGKLPFKLETGYIGVGKSEEVQLFYYFIESERSPKDDPLMLWLTGGPGCSGLSGLLFEIGPFTIDNANSSGNKVVLELNPHSWTKVANIIFVDSPVGTGFSYARTPEAYRSSDTLSAKHSYDFLRKWLINHSKFLGNPLYIGGDSYTGQIIPIIVEEIYNGNEAGNEPLFNIKGYLEGNALTDKNKDVISRISFAHRLGLLSDKIYESAIANCHGDYLNVDPSNTQCISTLQKIKECTEKIRLPQILEPWCTSLTQKTNLLAWGVYSLDKNPSDLYWSLPLTLGTWCRDYNYLYSPVWANDRSVRRDLHVREGTAEKWVRCNNSLYYDIGVTETTSYTFNVQSTFGYHQRLTTKSCRALIYSGDHDMVVPYLATQKWIESLSLPVETDWRPWYVEGQVAGYTMRYSKNDFELTYATVKGAGHTAPEYNPKQCLAMVSRFFAQDAL